LFSGYPYLVIPVTIPNTAAFLESLSEVTDKPEFFAKALDALGVPGELRSKVLSKLTEESDSERLAAEKAEEIYERFSPLLQAWAEATPQSRDECGPSPLRVVKAEAMAILMFLAFLHKRHASSVLSQGGSSDEARIWLNDEGRIHAALSIIEDIALP
jgi:hypothetical protein